MTKDGVTSGLVMGEGGRVCRVVYVVMDDMHVLLHRSEADPFWSLPGGGCEVGETSHEALLREAKEEMGVDVTVERLLWVVENIFRNESDTGHGVELFYKVELPEGSRFRDKETVHEGVEGPLSLTFKWFPISEIDQLDLVPRFLYEGLKSVPDRIVHVINREVDGDVSLRMHQ